MSLLWSVSGTLLFFFETYHAVTHACILFRLRMLPERDLVKQRYYFLLDLLTVFFTCFVYTQQMQWLAILQHIQHLYYFLTWNKTDHTIKVIRWSSLDWTKSKNNDRWHWEMVLGTGFDMVCHIVCMYLLWDYVGYTQVAVAIVVLQVFVFGVLFNSRLAWATPGNEPSWVAKRLGHVPTY